MRQLTTLILHCILVLSTACSLQGEVISPLVEENSKPVVVKAEQSADEAHTSANALQETPANDDESEIYTLASGHSIVVTNKTINIKNREGTVVLSNSNLIRGLDGNETCPSEGFMALVTKGNYFTIEQQNCSGWQYINEYITFKYSDVDKEFYLHKFGLQYIDRAAPENIEEKVVTPKQFGSINFTRTSVDELYKYAN
jgi:hypothetical protein